MPPKSRRAPRVKPPVTFLRCSQTELMTNTRQVQRPPWFVDRKLQKVLVYNGVYPETSTGMRANQLVINRRGKVVSRKKHTLATLRAQDRSDFGVDLKRPADRWKYVRDEKKHPEKRSAPRNYAISKGFRGPFTRERRALAPQRKRQQIQQNYSYGALF